jgi:WD40 repeat protein/predicted Ser/Thr protein kinase
MTETPTESTGPEACFEEAVAQFLRQSEQGEDTDPEQFLHRFPHLAGQLQEYFAGLALFQDLAPHLAPLRRRREAASAEPSTGRDVAGFEVLGELGRGGMGVVYRARQQKLDRVVALKMIRSGGWAGPSERARFATEARAAACLQHPGIVQVFEVGEHQGLPFLVLELVEGGSLARRCRGEPWQPQLAAALVEKLARTIAHAHGHGIIHRDLKPSNILLTADGEPKIADFGLAKRTDVDDGLSRTGAILGTPSYMAPEQAAGKGSEVGPAVDLWALGAILYELLTGRPPFRAASVLETLNQVRTDEPVPPSRLVGRLPRDLETICLKCLHKEPARRYASASALADELGRFLKGEPILARPVGPAERFRRWCKRNPKVAALTAAVVTLVVVVAVGATAAAVHFAEQAETEKRLKTDAEQARANAEEKEKETRRTLADSYTSFGLAAGGRDDPRQAVLWFAHAARLAGDDLERADANRTRAAAWARQAVLPVRALVHPGEWVENNMAFHPAGRHLLTHGFKAVGDGTTCMLWDLEAEVALPFPGSPPVVSAAAWDSAGERLAVGTPQGEVTICRFPGGEPLQRMSFAGRIARVLFSPDGRYCAVAVANRARVWDCQQETFATPELEHPAPIATLAFHPRGELLATTCADQSCRIFAVPTEQSAPLFPPVPHRMLEFQALGYTPVPPLFLDDGRRLLTLDRNCWRDPRTGRVLDVRPFSGPDLGELITVLAPGGGKHLVVAGGVSGNQHVRIYDAASAQPVSPDLEHRSRQWVWSAAFSPDGKRLLTGGSDHTARLWSVPAGKPLGGPLMHPMSLSAVAFAPDGRHLATAQRGGLIRLWSLPAGNPHDYRVAGVASSFFRLSGDGRFLLPAGLSNWRCELRSTQVIDLATGQRVGAPLPADGFLMDAAFSPDGQQVAAAVSRAASSWVRQTQPGQQPGRLLLWDWRAGKLLHDPLDLPSEPRKLDDSPDGRQLAVIGAKGELIVVERATGKVLRQWQAYPPHLANGGFVNNGAVRFSPDSRSLLTFGPTGTHSVRVWDALTGQLLHELPHKGGGCHDVQFSPDGRLVATAGFDNRACVWELATGEKLATLDHPDWAFSAVFSPDGKHLLTACRDGMARLWDWRAGRLVCPPFEHEHEVLAVRFTPDGRHVLSASQDGVLKVWEWRTGKPVCPPFSLGGVGLSLALTPDGRRVACGGFLRALPVFHLDDWLAPAELGPDDLCVWGEIVSGQRVEDGGGVTNLTAEEWLERWQAFRQHHPEFAHFSQRATSRAK